MMRDAEEVAREAWQAVADSIHRDDQSAVDAMAEVIRARDAELLRDAAEDFATGAWHDAWMTDRVDDDVSAVRSTDKWLRERADRIERGDQS